MENVVYNCTLSYGTCQSLGRVYSFFINVYDISYLSGSNNQISYKRGWRSDNTRYETFSIIFTHVILSMCCTESYCTRWEKGVKYASPSTKGFRGIFVGIPEYQKGYLVYVTSTGNIISSYDVVFDESFSSTLPYTSQPHSEAMAMRPAVTYTTCATSLREQTGNIITFAQFEQGNILTKIFNDAESGDESDNGSMMMSEEYMDAIDSGDESYHDLIFREMLEDIRDRSQTHPNVNRRE